MVTTLLRLVGVDVKRLAREAAVTIVLAMLGAFLVGVLIPSMILTPLRGRRSRERAIFANSVRTACCAAMPGSPPT
jgi:hypothetical protein